MEKFCINWKKSFEIILSVFFQSLFNKLDSARCVVVWHVEAQMNVKTLSSPLHLFLLVFFILSVDAFYFSSPADYYNFNDTIQAKTVKLTSIPRALPFGVYSFYGKDLPFCKPDKVGGKCDLGQCISGDWIQNSLYTVRLNQHTE